MSVLGRGVSSAFEFEGMCIERRKGSSREEASVSFRELGAFGIWITDLHRETIYREERESRKWISIDKLMVW